MKNIYIGRKPKALIILPKLLIIFLLSYALEASAQCVSLTTLGSAYTQNFDVLSNTAGSTTNNLTIPGWFLTEGGGGARDNEQYGVDTGSSTTGDTYSYGAAGNTERALGQLRSGTLISIIGVCFTNNTGATISSLAIAYNGEEWRLGTASRTDQMNFEYSLNATDLVTGTWTNVAALNFITPDIATTGAKNGNAAADRTALSSTISSLSIANGATFWIRWSDMDASGADDGLAVDDFSLTPQGPVVQPNLTINDISLNEGNSGTTSFTFTVSLSSPAPAGGVTFDIATADGTATQPGDYTQKSLTGQTIPAGSSTYSFTVLVNGDATPETNETFFVNITNVTGATVTDGQGQGTITNDDTCPTVNITVSETSGTTNNDGSICVGSSVTLSTSGGGTYLWSTGSTDPSIMVSPTMTTNYSVTVTNGVCEGMASREITVDPIPAQFMATGGGTDCTGTGVEVGVSGSELGVSYFLYRNNLYVTDIPGTGNALSFGLQPAGTYTVIAAYPTNCFVGMIGNPVVSVGSSSATTTAVTSSPNPSFTGDNVTFTATVTSGGNPVTTGTVTFTEGATVLAADVPLNGSGQATFSTAALTEGSHSIVATYNGASCLSTSNGSVTQVVNNRTVVNGNSFCNTGSITINDGGNDGVTGAAATPYPSNIFVSGLSGTISSITVDLKGLTHSRPDNIDLLLVAPTGEKFLMMTGVGQGATFNNTNLTLSDAAGSALPQVGAISSGTYRPASYEANNVFPAPAPASPYSQPAPQGTATFASVFNGIDPNGTWQLYAVDDTTDNSGSIAGGWCLNIVTTVTTGTIVYQKALAGDGDPNNPDQGFTLNLKNASNQIIAQNANIKPGDTPLGLGNLAPGSYSVSEINTPANWKISNIGCTSQNGQSTFGTFMPGETSIDIELASGDFVICTVTNEYTPTGDLDVFKFRDINKNGVFNGAGGETPVEGWQIKVFAEGADTDNDAPLYMGTTDVTGHVLFAGIPQDNYIVCEEVRSHWTITTGTVCRTVSIGAGTTNVEFANFENRTYTFRKVSTPATNTAVYFDWTLQDINGANPGDITVISDDPNGTTITGGPNLFTITELVPTGWKVDKVVCNGQEMMVTDNSITFDTRPAETDVVCTFYDVRETSITIIKEATPKDGTDFNFTTFANPGGTLGTFSLDDDDDPTLSNMKTFTVQPGTYGFLEAPLAGWVLKVSDLQCVSDKNDPFQFVVFDQSGGDFDGARGPVFDIAAGENVTCTFVNVACTPLEATTSPNNAVVCAGMNTGSFSGAFSGTNPVYQWQVNDGNGWVDLVDGGTEPMIVGATTTDLSLTNIPISWNGYLIRLKGTNECTTGAFTDEATLTVNPVPQVNAVSNMTYCAGDNVPSVVFSSNVQGATFEWSRTNEAIGLGTNAGSGNIPAFTAVNNTSSPITATFSVVAVYENNDVRCTGTPIQFTITVNPNPQVNAISNMTYCAGDNVPSVVFSSNVPGATFDWSRTNEAIGLGTNSGMSNVPSFTATNNGSTPITATFSVVASYENNGVKCTGTPIQFTITINPVPQVNPVSNMTYCAGDDVPQITFSSNVPGVTFDWSRTNEAIGLGVNSGSGNIPAFTASNNSPNPLTATFSVVATYENNGVRCTGTPIQFTITVNPKAEVEAGTVAQAICLTKTVDLTQIGASITRGGAAFTGTWSILENDSNGQFLPNNIFGTATTFKPGKADGKRGFVTLVLTSDDPDGDGPCEPVSDQVRITILNVDCGQFPWNGQ